MIVAEQNLLESQCSDFVNTFHTHIHSAQIMESFILPTMLVIAVNLAAAQISTRATYDATYDNASGNTNSVACGGQLSGRFPTFGSLPAFPRIGGTSFINNSSSPNCGSCWRLELEGSREPHIFFLAVDVAGDGFNISEEAMLELAGQDGINNGSISITASAAPGEDCGFFTER